MAWLKGRRTSSNSKFLIATWSVIQNQIHHPLVRKSMKMNLQTPGSGPVRRNHLDAEKSVSSRLRMMKRSPFRQVELSDKASLMLLGEYCQFILT